MTAYAQLEIINSQGDVAFLDISPRKNIVNIGAHPDNDIVIDSPFIDPFHAIIDFQNPPFQITILSENVSLTLNDDPLPHNTPVELYDSDIIEEPSGFTIVALIGDVIATGLIPGTSTAITSIIPGTAPYPDLFNEKILLDSNKREWATEVDKAVNSKLSIVNGGDIVASFNIHIEGIPSHWVSLSTPQVNLNEGENAAVTLAINPPRHPTSRAGVHYVGIKVTSPNYPNAVTQIGATLIISPYYEFSIGELSPKLITLTWGRQEAVTNLPVNNKSNSSAPLQLEAEDEENACTFEILPPDSETSLTGEVEFALLTAESAAIPITITPHSRRLIGFRTKKYTYTVTTALAEQGKFPRSVVGQIRIKPLIGLFHIILFILTLIIAAFIAIMPRISEFEVTPEIVNSGEPVTLTWKISPFVSSAYIHGIGNVDAKIGTIQDIPTESVKTYWMDADNFLSGILPSLLTATSNSYSVVVLPKYPAITDFGVNKDEILEGEEITLHWAVENAEKIELVVNGVRETIPLEESIGQRKLTPQENTIYKLSALNPSGVAIKSFIIRVSEPLVDVLEFNVEPKEITAGDTVTISWNVSGVENVQIAPLSEPGTTGGSTESLMYPPSGSTSYAPAETMDFVLLAKVGAVEIRRIQNVVVNPVALAPTIEYFTIIPPQNVADSAGNASTRLTWSITGDVTYVEIRSPEYGALVNLNNQGVYDVTVNSSTIFTLTGFNGDAHTSQVLQFTIVTPTPTPAPSVTPTP